MEGFDVEGFKENYRSYGEWECNSCSVPKAMKLREDTEALKSQWRERGEDLKREKPSWLSIVMAEHDEKPEAIRQHKTYFVKLRLYEDEDIGGAKGKSCDVRNKYRCPYGELSETLINDGHMVDVMVDAIEWYDRSQKWDYYDDFLSKYGGLDSGLAGIDLASYYDVRKSVSDGRLLKLLEIYVKYREMECPSMTLTEYKKRYWVVHR